MSRSDVRSLGGATLILVVMVAIALWQTWESAWRDATAAAAVEREVELKSVRESAFLAGRKDGELDAVTMYVSGVDPGLAAEDRSLGPRCRVTSNVRQSGAQTGAPAPTRECRLLRDGSLWIPEWRR